jgi:hypothetical protein
MKTKGNLVISLLLFGTLYILHFVTEVKSADRILGKIQACLKQKDHIPANSASKIKAYDYDIGTCFIQCLELARGKKPRKCKTVVFCKGDPAEKCIIYDQKIMCSSPAQFIKVDKRKKCRVWSI